MFLLVSEKKEFVPLILPHAPSSSSLSTDQQYFVTASYDRTFKLWENE